MTTEASRSIFFDKRALTFSALTLGTHQEAGLIHHHEVTVCLGTSWCSDVIPGFESRGNLYLDCLTRGLGRARQVMEMCFRKENPFAMKCVRGQGTPRPGILGGRVLRNPRSGSGGSSDQAPGLSDCRPCGRNQYGTLLPGILLKLSLSLLLSVVFYLDLEIAQEVEPS